MPEKLSEFLRNAAACLRELALRAPDIANELRRFAGELDEDAERAARKGGSLKDDAAEDQEGWLEHDPTAPPLLLEHRLGTYDFRGGKGAGFGAGSPSR